MKIQGSTFIISGGASGLGFASAQEIISHGGNAAILDLHETPDITTLSSSSAKFFPCDVQQTTSITTAITAAAQWALSENKPLRGVIPAAGVSLPATMLDRNVQPLPLDGFDFVLGVNLRGTLDVVRQALPHIARAPPLDDEERGIVIMVASSAAFDGQKGQVSYSASKGAITAMTLPMARDLSRYGIRVVTIAPSLFESRMTSVMPERVRKSLEGAMEFPRRAGQPREFAQLVRQAVENVMLNGVVVRLDGGMRMPSKM